MTDRNMVVPPDANQREKQQLIDQFITHQKQIDMQKQLEALQAQQQLQKLQDRIGGQTNGQQ